MADCDNTDYQMIDLTSLTDIENAQVVTASIDSIDTNANTADITLFDSSCEALAGVSLEDVEFFYHCEDSTGTLEDLARGSNAFRSSDIVYVLYIPVNGDVAEKFYIVGHVDIKGTKICEVSEYLLFKTTNSYTIFDVAAGTTLDIDEFENIDDGSPPKPTRLPFQDGDTDYLNAWLAYNFSESVAGASLGGTVDELSLSGGYTTDLYRNDNTGYASDPGIKDYEDLSHLTVDSENIIHNITTQYGSNFKGVYGYASMNTSVSQYTCTGESEGVQFYDSASGTYRHVFLNLYTDHQTENDWGMADPDQPWYSTNRGSFYSAQGVELTTDYDGTNETLWSISGTVSGAHGYLDGIDQPSRSEISDAFLTCSAYGGNAYSYKHNYVSLYQAVVPRKYIAIIGFYGFYLLYYYNNIAMEFTSSAVTVCEPVFDNGPGGGLYQSLMGEQSFLSCTTPTGLGDGINHIPINIIYPFVSLFADIDISGGVAGMFDLVDNRSAYKSGGLQSCIDDLLSTEFEFCALPEIGDLADGIIAHDAYRKKSDIV